MTKQGKVRSCGVLQIPLYRYINLDSKMDDWGLDGGSSSTLRYEGTSFDANVRGERGASVVNTASFVKCSDPTRVWAYDIGVENEDKGFTLCNRTQQGRVGAVRLTKDWKSRKYIDVTIVVWEKKILRPLGN